MEYGRVMSGWGRISLLVGAGVLLGAGCGGRTNALEGDYGTGADGGSLSVGGSSGVAGRFNRGGSQNSAGAGGTTIYTAGSASGGGGPYPAGGYGGYGYAGSYPVAGAPYGGYGYGGYGYAGYGGYGYAGTYSGGGYVGQGPDACDDCLRQECAPQLVQCLQDFGCLAIFSCMRSTGCQAFECYSPEYCQGTIDQWGGPAGQAMGELLQTFSCAVTWACPCD